MFNIKNNYQMKKLFLLASLFTVTSTLTLQSQVTIGVNRLPQATLEVVAAGNTPAGVIAPLVDRKYLNDNAAKYTSSQTGAIVYVNNVTTGTATGQAEAVTVAGYYYYDGAAGKWKAFGSGTTGNPTTPSVTWIYCPPFNLDLNVTSVNLFEKYVEGLSGYTASNKKTTGATAIADLAGHAEDFDYLVRCESESITITGISASGVMSYTITGTPPKSNDFISVVLIRK